MASSHRQPLAWATILSLALGGQAVTTYCPSAADNICYGVGIPTSTASKGSGNIYFSISAPTSYQWVALGTGSMMSGSNIFVMYQDGTGNVTVSPRLGTFHTAPSEDTSSSAAQLTLLAGSGVSGDTMTANVMCANCESWGSGGKLSVASTSAPWIGAWRAGSSLATANKNAALAQHDDTAQYKLDLTKATISTDSNPFVSSSGGGSSSGGSSGGGSSGGGSTSSGDSGSDTGSGTGSGAVAVSSPSTPILTAHAVVMALVMVVLYPLGSSLMPLLGKWLVHGVWQGLAYLLMWAGFALGVVAARQRGLLYASQGKTHTVLGTVVVAAMAIQPLLGLWHHGHFVKHQRRGFVSHWHIWWGRLFMVLGIVNGGLGLHLALASRSVIIGYSVASAVLFLAYIAGKAVGTYVLAPRRQSKGLGRSVSVSGNGRMYDDGSRYRSNSGRPRPDMRER